MTTHFTDLEVDVFNLLARESMAGGLFDVKDIAELLKLPVATVKGVVGSLTKKGKVDPDQGETGFQAAVVWAVHPIHGATFWTDHVSQEEFEAALLVKSETKSAAPKTERVTKISQARTIASSMRDPSRKNLIREFINVLGMTPAGASTYAQTVRKEMK